MVSSFPNQLPSIQQLLVISIGNFGLRLNILNGVDLWLWLPIHVGGWLWLCLHLLRVWKRLCIRIGGGLAARELSMISRQFKQSCIRGWEGGGLYTYHRHLSLGNLETLW